MKQLFFIRYNTTSTGNHDRWRIIANEEEILVSEILINVPSYTSQNEMPEVGLKYHIACEGVLTIQEDKAEIN
ncbi:MAG: hypothetical protein V4604_13755 [Bacteroidota bacterium]